MMMLEDVRDYIASLDVAEHVYMGKLPDKEDKSVGVYNSKHQNVYHTALGGPSLEGYGVDVYNTTKDTPLKYINGQNTVTYFGMILFSE